MSRTASTQKNARLPFVFLNVAMTADGKLAPSNRHFTPFTTKRDQTMMLDLRATADAVLSGARTVDLGEVTLGVGGEKYRKQRRARGLSEEHLRIIASGSGTLDPNAYIFTHKRTSPIIVLTTERAGKRLPALQKAADAVHISPGKELDFHEALAWLKREWGVKRLLCEGGGAIIGGLFDASVVDELYLTIAPAILGGRTAPTPVDGKGISRLTEAHPLKLKRLERVGDELYTVWSVPEKDSK
jgi:2,5-diamino-6-(ribosylamino)-4(3H)-pyrimidinone 5'-phosphate reductase